MLKDALKSDLSCVVAGLSIADELVQDDQGHDSRERMARLDKISQLPYQAGSARLTPGH